MSISNDLTKLSWTFHFVEKLTSKAHDLPVNIERKVDNVFQITVPSARENQANFFKLKVISAEKLEGTYTVLGDKTTHPITFTYDSKMKKLTGHPEDFQYKTNWILSPHISK